MFKFWRNLTKQNTSGLEQDSKKIDEVIAPVNSLKDYSNKPIDENFLYNESFYGDTNPSKENLQQDVFLNKTKSLAKSDEDFDVAHVVLFAGISNSGKSTFVKQLKMNFGSGYSETEVFIYRHIIFLNLIADIRSVIKVMAYHGMSFKIRENDYMAEKLRRLSESSSLKSMLQDEDLNTLAGVVQQLIGDEGFQLGIKKSFLDNGEYLIYNSSRILLPEFIPNSTDILMSRQATPSAVHETVKLNSSEGLKYELLAMANSRIIDVGGFRYQRHIWAELCPAVNAIVYVHSLPCYDLPLEENPSIPQLVESLNAFDELINAFDRLPVILLLNKKDVFEEKIKHKPLRAYTVKYFSLECKPDYESSIQFMKDMFMARSRLKGRVFHVYVTCAINEDQAKAVLKMITSIARRKENNLRS